MGANVESFAPGRWKGHLHSSVPVRAILIATFGHWNTLSINNGAEHKVLISLYGSSEECNFPLNTKCQDCVPL